MSFYFRVLFGTVIHFIIVCSFCLEIEELADHGITLPPNMQGLTDEQIEELKLKDEWADKCYPSGGHIDNKDDIGRRNGIGNLSLVHLMHLLIML